MHTQFTRTIANMSMVRYILRLGDHHPSNLVLDQKVAVIYCINVGNCFVVAVHREKTT